MRKLLSAVIIDPNKKEHDYNNVKTTFGKYFENNFDLKVVESTDNILAILNDFKGFDCLITIGSDINFTPLNQASFEIRKKWSHFQEFNAASIVSSIIATFQLNIGRDRGSDKLFSIFTCTFNTPKSFLKRLYNSLNAQTYHNWNWWILDDSNNDNTIKYINEFNDPRITVIKNVTNHGNIGFNKHAIASICDGDYLVEVDHDDELTTNCLELLKKAFDTYEDCDFVYSYAMEEMDGKPVKYDGDFALGLGRYEKHDVNEKIFNVAVTADINALSLRHIVGLPNHVRCWKKDFYHKIGGHNTDLSVLDDMDILIRTFLEGKICKIPKVLYIQHEGSEHDGNGRGSTTQGQRLKEIGRVGYLLKEKYDKAIHEKILSLGKEDTVWVEEEEYSDIFNRKDLDRLETLNYILETEEPAE